MLTFPFVTSYTVLGHGTAVFEDLGAYMSSLTKCFDTLSALPNGEAIQLYPGHGEVIDNGAAKLKEYLKHRQEREDQVVEALKSAKDGEKSTAEGCVRAAPAVTPLFVLISSFLSFLSSTTLGFAPFSTLFQPLRHHLRLHHPRRPPPRRYSRSHPSSREARTGGKG